MSIHDLFRNVDHPLARRHGGDTSPKTSVRWTHERDLGIAAVHRVDALHSFLAKMRPDNDDTGFSLKTQLSDS